MEARQLFLDLNQVHVREFVGNQILLKEDSFVVKDFQFEKAISQNETVSNQRLKALIQERISHLFVSDSDLEQIRENRKKNLRLVSQSLSFGDPVEVGVNHLSLMINNLERFYTDPLDDETLKLLYQSSSNLVPFVLENNKIIPEIYRRIQGQKHFFLHAQPILSSLFLVSFLKYLQCFSEKEIQSLFVTSFLKDLGMCYLSHDSHFNQNLNEAEVKGINDHAMSTVMLINQRIPINKRDLEIIANHHYHSELLKELETRSYESIPVNKGILLGAETLLVSVTDVLVAATTDRPFRDSVSLFEILTKIKKLMVHNYSSEFKNLVHFSKKFFQSP